MCLALTIGASAVFIAGAQAWTSATQGVQDTGVFQLDGNTLPGACTSTAHDWAGLYNATASPPCGAAGFAFVNDGVGSADKTYWSSGGSKDAYDPASGPWQWGPNNVSPDKNDLDNAFAAIYNVADTNPSNTSGTAPILFFGSDRYVTNGDAQQGFQFLQANSCLAGATSPLPGSAACPSATPTHPTGCSPAFTGSSNTGYFVDPGTGCPVHHRDGDLLILVNFNNGGTLGSAGVFEWGPTSGSPHPNTDDPGGAFTQVVFGNTADCKTVSDPNSFCATSNTGPLAGEPVWPYTAKGTTGQATYAQGAFIEGGLNLASIAGAGTCFPSFVAETRSSAGPGTGLGLTAQLKDLVFGKFELCGASISIGQSGVNEVSHSHTFTVTVNGTSAGGAGPISGVNPTVTLTGSSGISGTYSGTGTLPGDFGDIHVTSDSCRSPGGTNSSGQCTVVFTSSKAGIVTGHATASVTLGGSTTFNVATDGVSPNSGDAVKRFVDAKIALSPLNATNEVKHAHTITATVSQDDGLASGVTGGDSATGFGPAPNGTVVTFSLLNNTAGASFVNGVNTCTVSNGLGTCTVQINSSTAGSVDIHATTTFLVGGVSLTRASGDGLSGDSANANKVYVDASIGIGPPLANNLVNQPHTFTVTVQQDDGLASGATGGDNATGPGPPPVGTLVNVTLTGSNGITGTYHGLGASQSTPAPPNTYGDINITSDSCRTSGTDSNGKCTIVFTSATTGTVTGHAAVDLTFGSVTVHRETDGTTVGSLANSGDAVKNFVAGSITWTKVDNAGNPLGGATFTYCKTKNYNFTTGMLDSINPVCTDVLDNSGQLGYTGTDTNTTAGTFHVAGLSLGEYTVTEKTAPAGFVADSTVAIVDLEPLCTTCVPPTSPDQTIAQAFVNHRPILKISGFGYTNVANGTPTHGVTSGTVTYTVNLHNYGDAAAVLSNSQLAVSTDSASGTLSCTSGNTQSITGTIAANGGDSTPFVVTCNYNMSTGDHVTALLTVKYTTNGLERNASGSPATIIYTVEGD